MIPDPFEKICSKRKDIVCIGGYIQIGNFKIALHHPGGACS